MTRRNSNIPECDDTVRDLATTGKRYEVSCLNTGLKVRVQAGGTKQYICQPLVNGKRKLITLGDAAQISYEKALKRLRKVNKAIAKGEDPTVYGDTKRAPVESRGEWTGDRLVDEFYTRRIFAKRAVPELVKGMLDRHIKPYIKGTPITQLTSDQLMTGVENLKAQGKLTHAKNVYAIARQMTKWAWKQYKLDVDPLARLDLEAMALPEARDMVKRDRVLSHAEITTFFTALDDRRCCDVTKCLLKLLLLTGNRVSEILLLEWRYVDLTAGTMTIPMELQKRRTLVGRANTKPQIVPLSSQAIFLLRRMKILTGASGYVCGIWNDGKTMNRSRPLNAVKDTMRLRKLTMPAFCVHDLRRTYRSTLESMEVDFVLAEQCIGHSVGGTVAAHYTHGDTTDARRRINQDLADIIGPLMGLGTGKPEPVTPERAVAG